jgi:hypothetical protein
METFFTKNVSCVIFVSIWVSREVILIAGMCPANVKWTCYWNIIEDEIVDMFT